MRSSFFYYKRWYNSLDYIKHYSKPLNLLYMCVSIQFKVFHLLLRVFSIRKISLYWFNWFELLVRVKVFLAVKTHSWSRNCPRIFTIVFPQKKHKAPWFFLLSRRGHIRVIPIKMTKPTADISIDMTLIINL